LAAEIVLSRKHGGDCILCMCRPVDHDGHVKPMFTAVGVDVNWGENANICVVCAGVMADLLKRPPREEVAELKRRHQTLLEQHSSLQEAFTEQGELIDKIKEGAKAQKKVRAA
jgi:hypothetical protein